MIEQCYIFAFDAKAFCALLDPERALYKMTDQLALCRIALYEACLGKRELPSFGCVMKDCAGEKKLPVDIRINNAHLLCQAND